MSTNNSSIKISLIENICHSLQRGYELWNMGYRKNDHLLLKEAVIWIHHGIELSLKQLLVQKNEFLVFENVDEAVRKLAHLRRQPSFTTATVLDLFEHGEGVYTVSFSKLVERVSIMLSLSEFSQGTALRENIDELTNYRNKIVHFSIEIEINRIIDLLRDLLDPLLALLEREITDEKFITCLPYIRASSKSLIEVSNLHYAESEERIIKLIQRFDGQEVNGNLFGISGQFILPKYQTISKVRGVSGRDVGFDILATFDSGNWAIELKYRLINTAILNDATHRLRGINNKYDKSWLIVMTEQRFRLQVEKIGIMFSSLPDIINLEKLLA